MAYYRVTKKQAGGGGGDTSPKIVFAGSAPRTGSVTPVTYTFTEAGTYQYYVFINSKTTVTASEAGVTLNGSALTPTNYITGSWVFYYGEVTVSVSDVIAATPSFSWNDTGIQLFVMKNCDVTAFSLVGAATNDGTVFDINLGGVPYLQVCQSSFYGGSNVFKYGIMNYVGKSIATPKNDSTYYYGFTYVIRIVPTS